MSEPMALDSAEVADVIDECERLRAELAERDATIRRLEWDIENIKEIEAKVVTARTETIVALQRDLAERDATIETLTDKLKEIRQSPSTYKFWRTNKLDGDREMFGCHYCPASKEGSIPIEHHPICVLGNINDLTLADVPGDPVSDEFRGRGAQAVKAALAERSSTPPDPRDATIARLAACLFEWMAMFDTPSWHEDMDLVGLCRASRNALAEQPSQGES